MENLYEVLSTLAAWCGAREYTWTLHMQTVVEVYASKTVREHGYALVVFNHDRESCIWSCTARDLATVAEDVAKWLRSQGAGRAAVKR